MTFSTIYLPFLTMSCAGRPRISGKCAKRRRHSIDSFHQYARYLGKAKLDLAAAVPVVVSWSMSSITRAIAADQVRQFLV
jgi:hypothetical protein